MQNGTVRRERARQRGEMRNGARKTLLLLRGFRLTTDDDPPAVRRASAIAYALDHYPVVLDEDDRLVGKVCRTPLTEAEREELEAGRPLLRALAEGLRFGPLSGGVGGHRTVDFGTLLQLGGEGVLQRIDEAEAASRAAAGDEGEAARSFPVGCRRVWSACLRFIERYADGVRARSRAATDPESRRRWDEVLSGFHDLPGGVPSTFRGALQLVWLVQVALHLDDISCTGHPDRYLAPFHRRDVAQGRLTRETTLALIEELYLRSNEVFGDWPETVMVGGTDARGAPVLNDLTSLCVEAVGSVGLVNPNVAICCREDTPDELFDLGLRMLGQGCTHPAFYNDRIIREGLQAVGVSPEDACHYQNSTCVEITPVGTSNVQPAAIALFPLKVLACLLNGGRDMLPGDASAGRYRLDPAVAARWARPAAAGGFAVSLTELNTFEAFLGAYKRFLSVAIRDWVEPGLALAERMARRGSCPLVSCLTADCLERGLDVARGGARYNDWGTIVAGFATTVDSLAAIREAVYQRRMVSLDRLAAALRNDFVGEEPLRRFLLNECPKYGNDHPEADALAVDLYDTLCAELSRYRTCLGGHLLLGLFSGWGGQLAGRRVSFHVGAGHWTAATPDGRKAREPLSENVGPAPGADRKGLTALVHSVTKTDHRRGLGGLSVNWRLQRSLLTSPEGRRRIVAMIRTFLQRGGFEVQINTVDRTTLAAARREPERHQDLTVRIAGYSEYFCRIGAKQQEEIMARREYADEGLR